MSDSAGAPDDHRLGQGPSDAEALRASEERFRSTFEQAAVGIGHVAPDGRFLRVNQRLCDLTGYSRAELLARTFLDITHPDDVAGDRRRVARMVAGELDHYATEKRYLRKDGANVWVSVTVSLVRRAGGEPDYFIGVVEDIGRRRAMEARLRDSEAQHRAVVETSPDGFCVVDTEGRILEANAAYQRMSGYTREELLTMTIADVETQETPEATARHIEAIRRDGHDRFDTLLRAKDGRVWPAEISVSFWDGERPVFFVFCRDISERRGAEAALHESHRQLRELSASLQTVREEERARIARELHDELGQQITGIKLDLSWLGRRVADCPPEVGRKLGERKGLIDGIVGSVRRISYELRPPILDDLGLCAAVEWLADEFGDRTGTAVHRELDHKVDRLPEAAAINVFRIVQECLTNVARHAQAETVHIQLRDADGEILVHVDDDGRGIADDASSNTRSLGLVGIRERAVMLGGRMQIVSAPGRGTSISVTIPWPTDADEDRRQ